MEQINRSMDYTRRYALAMISPVTVLLAGVTFYYFAIREPPPEGDEDALFYGVDLLGLLNGLYYSVITMTVRRAIS